MFGPRARGSGRVIHVKITDSTNSGTASNEQPNGPARENHNPVLFPSDSSSEQVAKNDASESVSPKFVISSMPLTLPASYLKNLCKQLSQGSKPAEPAPEPVEHTKLVVGNDILYLGDLVSSAKQDDATNVQQRTVDQTSANNDMMVNLSCTVSNEQSTGSTSNDNQCHWNPSSAYIAQPIDTSQNASMASFVSSRRSAFSCLFCERILTTIEAARRHRRYHESQYKQPVQCPECLAVLTSKWNLLLHRKAEHQQVAAGGFHCRRCVRTFSEKSAFLKHAQLHRAVVVSVNCSHCAKRFASTTQCIAHEQTHDAM